MKYIPIFASILLASCGADPLSPEAKKGEALVAHYGCTNCHAATEDRRARLTAAPAPDLTRVGSRLTRAGLASQLIRPKSNAQGDFACASNVSVATALKLQQWIAGENAVDIGPVPVQNSAIARGRRLFDSVGCYACHTESNGWDPDSFQGDYSITSLASFLAHPFEAWPSGRHPSFGLDDRDAEALSTYLLVREAPESTTTQGLVYEYYEEDDFNGDEPLWAEMEPVTVGIASAIDLAVIERDDRFALRFSGEVSFQEEGLFEFFLTSDDGSILEIDGELVISHLGMHGPDEKSATVKLEAGLHSIVVGMFERDGGEELRLEFAAPGKERRSFKESELYSTASTYKAPDTFPGKRLSDMTAVPSAVLVGGLEGAPHYTESATDFTSKGCASCHELRSRTVSAPTTSIPLADLNATRGCLAVGVSVEDSLPRFAFQDSAREDSGAEVAQIRAYLNAESRPKGPLDSADFLARELARLNCLACHTRDGVGGPAADTARFFGQTYEGDDLGAEGHFPPSLTSVGAKLNAGWMSEVIGMGTSGGTGVRPYVEVEMPAFPVDVAERLAVAFAAVDTPAWEAAYANQSPPDVSDEAIHVGQELVGTKGFSCITCHVVAGKPSLGFPMIDLATTPERLRYDWFREWVEHPTALRPGTRMAGYWVNGKSARTDIYDGDAKEQIDAIWTYLSLGPTLPLPAGLVFDPGAFVLEPSNAPIYHACFFLNASARTMAVGFPERKHAAFDFEHLRLHSLWYGDFVNAAATWDGRAGGLAMAAGQGVLELPAGLAIAELTSKSAAWPVSKARAAEWNLLGHTRSADGLPTFRYGKGDVIVEETIAPVLGSGGHFRRSFRVTGVTGKNWYLRLGVADRIRFGANEIVLTGSNLVADEPGAVVSMRIAGDSVWPKFAEVDRDRARFVLAKSGVPLGAHDSIDEQAELLVAIDGDEHGVFELTVEMQW